jgi:hypothetical protein
VHWEKQKCYTGKAPNAEGTRKSLKAEQIRLHSQLKRSTALAAQQMVQQFFPPNCEVLSGDFHYCINGSAFSKRFNNIKRHFGTRNKELLCNSSLHSSRSKGKVSKGLHGFQCPSAIVEQFKAGNSLYHMSILYYQPSINLSPPPTITTMARELTSGPMEACCMKENGKTVLWMEMGHSTIQMETYILGSDMQVKSTARE